MRTFKLMGIAALALSTAACVESVDGNYGYSDGYYAPNQATYYGQPSYAQPAYYAPTYYAPTQVVTQTRYVPVPVAVPQHTFSQQANGSNDHRGDGNRGSDQQRHDRPQANNTPAPAPTPQQPSANQHHGNGNANSHDRDGDGRPDRRS